MNEVVEQHLVNEVPVLQHVLSLDVAEAMPSLLPHTSQTNHR